MAAFETPWLASMSALSQSLEGSKNPRAFESTPTIASFSPATLTHTPAAAKLRSTLLVHQKSPLLVATPPQVTRALAYSHPFILPLNHVAGLLTWSGEDPWESLLLLICFWVIVLYGGLIIRYSGPILIVVGLILGIYSRRWSPLSSTTWGAEKRKKGPPSSKDAGRKHHKSLDEIVETLRQFTTRCNILLDPFLQLTSFLSTQRTATSATTRPALTTLLVRITSLTPLWVILTIPPIGIITARRIVLTVGTIALTWHSRPARVSRLILWRSRSIRRIVAFITGLNIPQACPPSEPKASSLSGGSPTKDLNVASSNTKNKSAATTPGIRFTFVLYENQRRWLGIGWTSSLLSYERAPWTDEQLRPSVAKDEFVLPDVEGGQAHAKWRWVPESVWKVDKIKAGEKSTKKRDDGSCSDEGGWIYYDNKWNDSRRQDGWGRYTRRRKWYRDAELAEDLSTSKNADSVQAPTSEIKSESRVDIRDFVNQADPFSRPGTGGTESTAVDDGTSTSLKPERKRRSWFRKPRSSDASSTVTTVSCKENGHDKKKEPTASSLTVPSKSPPESKSPEKSDREKPASLSRSARSGSSGLSTRQEGDEGPMPLEAMAGSRHGADWGVGDDIGMGLS